MPYNVSYCNNGFYVSVSGVISHEEIHRATTQLFNSADFDAHTHQVINFLDADLSNIELIKVKKNSAIGFGGSKIKPNVKVALIAIEDISVICCEQYIRTAEQLGSSWKIKLFDNLIDATQWAQAS